MQQPYRHIQSVTTAFSGRWTAWYALGLYSFFLLLGLVEVRTSTRTGYLLLGSGVFGFAMLAIGWWRLRAMHTLPSAPFDPYAPAWVRELPTTPAIVAFGRRRLVQMLAVTGGTVAATVISLALIDGRAHSHYGLVVPIMVGAVSVGIVLAMLPLNSDTRCATYWEAAGPLRIEIVWQMTQPIFALHVGNERLILLPKAAKRIAGVPWCAVAATRRTAQVIEVRDWLGNVVYRAPGYRP